MQTLIAALFTSALLCPSTPPVSNPDAGSHWNGWGANVANTRFQTGQQAGLAPTDVPKLKLKWAFGIDTVTQARSQPAVVDGRLYMASDSGMIYALDAKTGCTY